eukprot:scaffold110838_cov34-Prasinocladus_malaysianus.AAC.1
MSVHMASHLSFSAPCMLGAKSQGTTVIDLVSSDKEDSTRAGGPRDTLVGSRTSSRGLNASIMTVSHTTKLSKAFQSVVDRLAHFNLARSP